MTPADALATIQGLAGANRIQLTPHALLRMSQRGARHEDVRRALLTASSCRAQDNGRWKVFGMDTDNDELTCIVEIEHHVVVVTIY